MDASMITAIITGLVTLVGAITIAAVSIIKALNENRTAIAKELVKSNEVQDKIHTAVNSNYQAMIEKELQREQQATAMTGQILELSKMVSMLNERLASSTGPTPPPRLSSHRSRSATGPPSAPGCARPALHAVRGLPIPFLNQCKRQRNLWIIDVL